jgi:hypothetical protein
VEQDVAGERRLKLGKTLLALVATAWAAGAPLASAATSSAAFSVRATVMAACTIAPQPWTGGAVCLTSGARTIPLSAAPLVNLSRDPATGALVETITF